MFTAAKEVKFINTTKLRARLKKPVLSQRRFWDQKAGKGNNWSTDLSAEMFCLQCKHKVGIPHCIVELQVCVFVCVCAHQEK